MRVRNDSAFFKRNITPLLGFHGHGGLGFVDDVSGVDWAVQNLTDIGTVPIIHLFIINKAAKHLFLVVTRLQDFFIVEPLGDAVKPQLPLPLNRYTQQRGRCSGRSQGDCGRQGLSGSQTVRRLRYTFRFSCVSEGHS